MFKFLMGIMLGVGIAGASISLYLSWNGLTIAPRQPIAQATATPTPTVTGHQAPIGDDDEDEGEEEVSSNEEEGDPDQEDNSSGNEGLQIESESDMPKLVAGQEPFMVFVLRQFDGEKERFTMLEDLESRLKLLGHSPHVSLRVKLPRDFFGDNGENKFRQWLVRLGDYIYSRRLCLAAADLEKVSQTMRATQENFKLMRTNPDDVGSRGCARFSQTADSWKVDIYGLEAHPEELLIVARDIFWRAFQEPNSIADCDYLRVRPMSHLLAENGFELEQNQQRLVDGLLKMAMKSQTVDIDNLISFFPLISAGAVNFSTEDIKIIEQSSNNFASEFNRKIVAQVKNFLPTSDVKPEAKHLNELSRNHYYWLVQKLNKWVKETKISEILLRSLFHERNW